MRVTSWSNRVGEIVVNYGFKFETEIQAHCFFPYSGPPNLLDNQQIVSIEGTPGTINLGQAPDAFPFPQQFSWTTNNNSRVAFGYPSVTFLPFIREDTGTYNLTATNYRLDNTSVVVGMDTGSFTLDVQCKFGFGGCRKSDCYTVRASVKEIYLIKLMS